MKILVTGATGFIGNKLCQALTMRGDSVVAVARAKAKFNNNITTINKVLSKDTDWKGCLNDIDVIIHLAGRAHVMNDTLGDPYQAYADINIHATKHLAEQAALSAVKRFIFISSIGVNGNQTVVPFNESYEPNPQEFYAISKKNAEDELKKIASETDLEVVIIRPPLVYGHAAKGNFNQLIKLCSLNLPLPLATIRNKRNLIYVENLVDFIVKCISHPMAANEVFLVADDETVSTAYLIKSIKLAMGKKALLFPLPQKVIHFLSMLIGKQAFYNKLCGNLQVDNSKAKKVIGWKPPYTFDDGIKKTFSINKNGKKNF